MTTKARCPHCNELCAYFEKVGAEDAPERCPNCHKEVDVATAEKVDA